MPEDTNQLNIGAEYTADEREFLRAIDAYRSRTRRKFVPYTDLLRILKTLGYRRIPDTGAPDEERRDAGERGGSAERREDNSGDGATSCR